jgi:hypothetical protein
VAGLCDQGRPELRFVVDDHMSACYRADELEILARVQ